MAWSPGPVQSYHEKLVEVVSKLNSGFICPQFLLTDADREFEIDQFSEALADISVT